MNQTSLKLVKSTTLEEQREQLQARDTGDTRRQDGSSLARFKIAALPVTLIELLWDRLEPFIDNVVRYSHNEATTETAKEQMLAGNVLTVVVCEDQEIIALTLLEIRTFDTGEKALFIPIFGGSKMAEWTDQMLNVLHAIAKDFGCTQLRGIGARKGWVRYLKTKGWEEYSVTVGCEVK